MRDRAGLRIVDKIRLRVGSLKRVTEFSSVRNHEYLSLDAHMHEKIQVTRRGSVQNGMQNLIPLTIVLHKATIKMN